MLFLWVKNFFLSFFFIFHHGSELELGRNCLIFPTSYELPDFKGYHAYMNSWNPIIGGNLQTRPEPENIMDKYDVAVLKDRQVVGHLTKGKSGRYAKTIFYFFQANQSNSAVVMLSYRDGQGLQIPCAIKFKSEENCFKILQGELNLNSKGNT